MNIAFSSEADVLSHGFDIRPRAVHVGIGPSSVIQGKMAQA
jgi:hypothetical protein